MIIQKIAGEGQSAPITHRLKVACTILLLSGSPVVGATINWGTSDPSGTLDVSSNLTNGLGEASNTLTVGHAPGTYTIVADAGSGVTAVFTVTVTRGINRLFRNAVGKAKKWAGRVLATWIPDDRRVSDNAIGGNVGISPPDPGCSDVVFFLQITELSNSLEWQQDPAFYGSGMCPPATPSTTLIPAGICSALPFGAPGPLGYNAAADFSPGCLYAGHLRGCEGTTLFITLAVAPGCTCPNPVLVSTSGPNIDGCPGYDTCTDGVNTPCIGVIMDLPFTLQDTGGWAVLWPLLGNVDRVTFYYNIKKHTNDAWSNAHPSYSNSPPEGGPNDPIWSGGDQSWADILAACQAVNPSCWEGPGGFFTDPVGNPPCFSYDPVTCDCMSFGPTNPNTYDPSHIASAGVATFDQGPFETDWHQMKPTYSGLGTNYTADDTISFTVQFVDPITGSDILAWLDTYDNTAKTFLEYAGSLDFQQIQGGTCIRKFSQTTTNAGVGFYNCTVKIPFAGKWRISTRGQKTNQRYMSDFITISNGTAAIVMFLTQASPDFVGGGRWYLAGKTLHDFIQFQVGAAQNRFLAGIFDAELNLVTSSTDSIDFTFTDLGGNLVAGALVGVPSGVITASCIGGFIVLPLIKVTGLGYSFKFTVSSSGMSGSYGICGGLDTQNFAIMGALLLTQPMVIHQGTLVTITVSVTDADGNVIAVATDDITLHDGDLNGHNLSHFTGCETQTPVMGVASFTGSFPNVGDWFVNPSTSFARYPTDNPEIPITVVA